MGLSLAAIFALVALTIVMILGVAAWARFDALLGVRWRRTTRRLADARAGAFRTPPIGGGDQLAQFDHALRAIALKHALYEASQKRYQLFAKHARDAIFFFRRSDARILEVSDAAVEMYGYSQEELLTMTGHQLRDYSVPQPTLPYEPFSLLFQTTHKRKDGTPFPVEIASQSAVLDGEHVVLSIIRDVTAQRRAEATIRSALSTALEATRLKSDFVATMSHEIRTPMNAVLGMSDLLLATELTQEQTEYASVLRDAAEQLLDVINDILDYSKIEARRLELEAIAVSPLKLVEGVVAVIAPAAAKKHLSLTIEVDPRLPHAVLTDPVRLHQVLVNLVGNAVKFTYSGEVGFAAELLEMADGRAMLRFVVRDTGIGIEQSALPSLFEAFSQGDASTTRRFGGAGLGLAISKGIVGLMGGQIEVESQPGRGSTFIVNLSLPISTTPPPVERGEIIPSMHDIRVATRGARVLVADDNVVNQRLTSRQLERLGITCDVASTGKEAVEMALRGDYDMLFMDCHMPEMDGFEATRAIREGERHSDAHVVIVAMTASTLEDDRNACIAAGMDDYLSKPFTLAELRRITATWLRPHAIT